MNIIRVKTIYDAQRELFRSSDDHNILCNLVIDINQGPKKSWSLKSVNVLTPYVNE